MYYLYSDPQIEMDEKFPDERCRLTKINQTRDIDSMLA